MIVVVIIGLLAAMALPAISRVTAASQDKAILNMARQLAAAADQYYLENGCSTVHTTDLVGPASYIKSLNRVTGHEQIPGYMTQGVTITIGNVAGQRTITYAP
jgi:type IV pilus assembly protein PilA